MKYNIVAKFVFLEIEAENETWAIEYTDEAFTNYVFHPQTNEKVFALYDVEAVEQTLAVGLCPTCNGFCNVSDRQAVVVCPTCKGTGKAAKA